MTGYFACYHFCPPAIYGHYATVCVTRYVGGDVVYEGPGVLPDCAGNPELCRIQVGVAEAIELARDAGYSVGAKDTMAVLRLEDGCRSFVWRVAEIDRTESCGFGKSSPDFFVHN